MENHIRTILFDFDGTIYQNMDFHRIYIHNLVSGTDKQAWEAPLCQLAEDVFKGRMLQMNGFYRVDAIEATDFSDYAAQLQAHLVADAPCGERVHSNEIYLGDAWSVVTLLGKTLNLLENGRGDKVFLATRSKMEKEIHGGHESLKEAIKLAGTRYETVLLSNSPEETASAFLRLLGFEGVFRYVGYGSKKPMGLRDALERQIPGVLNRSETILSIGDHAFNDLMPINAMGGKTVWMNPCPGIHEPAYDVQLRSLDDLAAFLKGMCI